jgi:hypothetical protein
MFHAILERTDNVSLERTAAGIGTHNVFALCFGELVMMDRHTISAGGREDPRRLHFASG